MPFHIKDYSSSHTFPQLHAGTKNKAWLQARKGGGGHSDLATVWHGVGHSDYLKCKQDLILCPIRSAIDGTLISDVSNYIHWTQRSDVENTNRMRYKWVSPKECWSMYHGVHTTGHHTPEYPLGVDNSTLHTFFSVTITIHRNRWPKVFHSK